MTRRVSVRIAGIVQGVGFRPFVWRLAARHRLAGWVRNVPSGVVIEAEGDDSAVEAFLAALTDEAPPLAVISSVAVEDIPVAGGEDFQILASSAGGSGPLVSPDWDVCPDCLRELFDPADRRYRYPFITCTNCGPRYSIVTGIPYDRPLTTMADFPLCPDCRREYDDPADRRFHAQPVACPACGPRLRLLDAAGEELPGDPVAEAVRLLREGRIVAVKSTGGYHLAVDPFDAGAVAELRRRKRRDEKPFALLAASIPAAAELVRLGPLAERLLAGPEKPIVLLERLPGCSVAENVAPGNGYLGIMLPSTPLQHLIMEGNFTALVMTSGNVSEEPVVHRDEEALARLAGIADFFLVHDRRIHVRSDDSVTRLLRGRPLVLRRSRGYVPRPVRLPFVTTPVVAAGAELKSAVCLTRGDSAFLGQHVGDLKNPAALAALEETAEHLATILEIRPQAVAHDLHPDYLSTRWALESSLPKVAVQHHHAHLASCMAENGLEGEVLGVIFDGTGFGPDGTVWGGEFLAGGYERFLRLGRLRHLPLPGGDAAVREPYRMALAALHAAFGDPFAVPLPLAAAVPEEERPLFRAMLERGLNSPLTSSCGRLFDAVAALLGIRSVVTYEGQAAIELEGVAERGGDERPYRFEIRREETAVLDLVPAIREITDEILAGTERAGIARRFHATVAAGAADMCRELRGESGLDRVVLSGGVFQNRLLTEELAELLEEAGFRVFTHRLVPPNDGGIALGQAAIAGWLLRRE